MEGKAGWVSLPDQAYWAADQEEAPEVQTCAHLFFLQVGDICVVIKQTRRKLNLIRKWLYQNRYFFSSSLNSQEKIELVEKQPHALKTESESTTAREKLRRSARGL